MKIFFIDRNIDFLKKIKAFLESQQFTVYIFDSIKEFQKEVKLNSPDLIISNVIFEGLSPFYVVKWINQNIGSNIPIICYSPETTKEIILLAKKYKIKAFLVYPFTNKDLLTKIKDLLKLPDNFTEILEEQKKDENIVKKNNIKNQIIINIEKLPSFPTIIREIEKLINSQLSDAKDFEKVIEKDQVITAKILKIVNSPFYSLNRKITTISEAVAYIGLDALRSIIYSASVSNLLKISLPAYGYKREQLWKHSYITAYISKFTAKSLNYSSKMAEELFVGGLLHDIGKIILGILAKNENINFLKMEEDDSIIDIEKRYLYFSHQEVGALIADKWKLPEIHGKIIRNHHLTEDDNDKDCLIVNFSDIISKKLLGIEEVEEKIEDISIKLGIDEKITNDIYKNTEELLTKIDSEGIF